MKPALKRIRDSNIKVWILTGDQLDTAAYLAVQCKMYSPHSDNILYLNRENTAVEFNQDELISKLEKFYKAY